MLTSKEVDHCLNTAWAIAASPYVHQFMIGFTAQPLKMRRSQYGTVHGYQYLVLLADRMNRADALSLEENLQLAVKQDRRHTLYRKYCEVRRDERYYRSAGPAGTNQHDLIHAVYMAWWEEGYSR